MSGIPGSTSLPATGWSIKYEMTDLISHMQRRASRASETPLANLTGCVYKEIHRLEPGEDRPRGHIVWKPDPTTASTNRVYVIHWRQPQGAAGRDIRAPHPTRARHGGRRHGVRAVAAGRRQRPLRPTNIGYHDYEGPAVASRARAAGWQRPAPRRHDPWRNHGLTTCGFDQPQALNTMYHSNCLWPPSQSAMRRAPNGMAGRERAHAHGPSLSAGSSPLRGA